LREQLALFETAHIGTLHSFCLQLVRQHFYELELDPQLSVLPNEEAHLLAAETLDGILQRHYAGRTPSAARVQELIEAQSRGADKSIRALILRLHHYMQTRPDSRGWLAAQEQAFARTDAAQWQAWL
jgi:ATP-dependent helicase/nuclease subunit A